jgi:hypothetical protein
MRVFFVVIFVLLVLALGVLELVASQLAPELGRWPGFEDWTPLTP